MTHTEFDHLTCDHWLKRRERGGFRGMIVDGKGICFECDQARRRQVRGLGDVVAKIATPIARALGLPCVDKVTRELKPNSPCARRRDALNAAAPFARKEI